MRRVRHAQPYALRMSWLHAVVYGILQGLTEYLPISSTAHLLIAGRLTGWGDPSAAFTAVIQVGTILAVLVYFRGELLHLLQGLLWSVRDRSLADDEGRMAWLLVLGSVPIMIFGFLLRDVIEGPARNLLVVGAALLLGGVVLAIADHRGTGRHGLTDLTWQFAIVLGIGQSFALIPGISRSGATIATALLLGFNRVAATRFSFLLAIPAVVVSGAYELRKVADGQLAWGPTLLATAISFVVGYACIHWLLKYVATHTFRWFVGYRAALGAVLIALVLGNVVTAI